MYKILKYIAFTVLFVIFIGSTFGIGLLSQYSTTIANIKTNFIDLIPIEIYFVLNWFLFVFIIFLIRNF